MRLLREQYRALRQANAEQCQSINLKIRSMFDCVRGLHTALKEKRQTLAGLDRPCPCRQIRALLARVLEENTLLARPP